MMKALTRKTPPLLAISMGDPAGVGPEVILQAASVLARRRGAPSIVVVGDLTAMRAAAARFRDVPAPMPWRHGAAKYSSIGILLSMGPSSVTVVPRKMGRFSPSQWTRLWAATTGGY